MMIFGSFVAGATSEVFKEHQFSPAHAKISFVSIWFAFAVALWILNKKKDRQVFDEISKDEKFSAEILVITGFLGGLFTGVAGSGVDICCFCVLTLYFRVSEKIATPTSVVLMAMVSIFGFAYKFFLGTLATIAWDYWIVSGKEQLDHNIVPVVPVGASLGAYCATLVTRTTLAKAVYVLCTVQLITGFIIILPRKPQLSLLALGIILAASLVFMILSHLGEKRISRSGNEPVGLISSDRDDSVAKISS
ncbi:Oidioi.mRNA.OKI2018_I69.chr2.g6801.t1.cds [Oikopleura dioica]|uniref:Oidioi.mRNA.OKI2018_I69.chr2.g6801.t1.cds n=1 Tax=Oikopleura dioica TaxID=34765 RepID=A0ABN7T7Z0_OIKDI|nr:Oidioi.mRNA.OKI2018_I69.chr2.g6801.t1.cds [Oikopleura dioica]